MSIRHSFFRLLPFLALPCAIAACSSAPPAAPPRLDWHPQLDQPIGQLEEILAALQQQQPMNYTSANLGFVLDAKLYLEFQRYLDSLSSADRATAVEDQRQWLTQRRRAFDKAYAEYEGGTLASYAGNKAFIEMTEARIREIEKQIGPPIP